MIKTYTAGGVVLNPSGLILVVSQNGDSWSLPKGHLESGEDALSAAKREIYEESGISDLQFVKNLGEYERFKIGKNGVGEDKTELKVITLFLFKTSQTDLKPIDPQNPKAVWLEKEKVGELLTHPKDREFYIKAIKSIEAIKTNN